MYTSQQSTLEELRTKVAVKVELKKQVEKALEEATIRKATIENEVEVLKEACRLLLALASEQQASVITFMNEVVTKGLQDIFGPSYKVEFKESTRANQRVIDIVLYVGDVEVSVPDGVGGGVTEVIALLLQIILVYLMRGRIAQTVILDETLSHLAVVYVPKAAAVLKEISNRLGVQLIIVTHQEDLTDSADVVYELVYDSKGTKAVRQEG